MTYTTCCIESWERFLGEVGKEEKRDEQWLYRGMPSSCWELETTLERACSDASIPLNKVPEVESRLLREFQRRFQQYSEYTPEKDDTLEWLSWMQHYRAPTRLLDWTYSAFVAAYFAFEAPKNDKVAIWALRWQEEENRGFVEAMKKQGHQLGSLASELHLHEKPPEVFNQLFRRIKRIPFVHPANPFRLNERLTLQQGIFMVPGDVSRPFMENLSEYQAMLKGANQSPLTVLKYVIPKTEREKALRHLSRTNISNATLFPGLEGFARSLATNMWLMTSRY